MRYKKKSFVSIRCSIKQRLKRQRLPKKNIYIKETSLSKTKAAIFRYESSKVDLSLRREEKNFFFSKNLFEISRIKGENILRNSSINSQIFFFFYKSLINKRETQRNGAFNFFKEMRYYYGSSPSSFYVPSPVGFNGSPLLPAFCRSHHYLLFFFSLSFELPDLTFIYTIFFSWVTLCYLSHGHIT